MLGAGFTGTDKGTRGWHLGDGGGVWRGGEENLGHTRSRLAHFSVKKETREHQKSLLEPGSHSDSQDV